MLWMIAAICTCDCTTVVVTYFKVLYMLTSEEFTPSTVIANGFQHVTCTNGAWVIGKDKSPPNLKSYIKA